VTAGMVKKKAQHTGLASLVLPRICHGIPVTAKRLNHHLVDRAIVQPLVHAVSVVVTGRGKTAGVAMTSGKASQWKER
jgi:hypothetical protein